jgi:phosphomevalonate kinase
MQISAPGKLILAGEYAVLDGAPGLVMAVDRRARVSLEPSSDEHWQVTSLQDRTRKSSFTFGKDGTPAWRSSADREAYLLVDNVLRNPGLLTLASCPPFALVLDTTDFFESRGGGQKLGLGSSAALTVALADALERWAGKIALDEQQQLAQLMAMHGTFQGGRGSGIDLAASLVGGVLEFCREPGAYQASLIPRQLPPGVLFKTVWTGRPASTPALLNSLERATRGRPQAWQRIKDRLAAGARNACEAIQSADADPLLAAIHAYAEDLRQLQEFSGIPIFTPEHEQLAEQAAGLGLAYKPSGAGGGDMGLALGSDPDVLAQFCQQAEHLGFHCPDLNIESTGLTGHN